MSQFQSLEGDRRVCSDIFNLLSKMSMSKGVKPRCHRSFPIHLVFKNMCSYTKFVAFSQRAQHCYALSPVGSERSLFSRMQPLELEQAAFSVFTTNPAKLMICLQLSQFFNTSPATLAGISPCSFLLHQLCFEFVEFWHVVSEEQVVT